MISAHANGMMHHMPRDRFGFSIALVAASSVAALTILLVVILGAPVTPRPRDEAVSERVGAPVGGVRATQNAGAVEPAVAAQPQASPLAPDTPPESKGSPKDSLAMADRSSVDAAPSAPAEVIPVTTSTTFPSSKPNPKADEAARRLQGLRGLAILQIGDSHTSADFFSGELRQRLQERYGSGGAGYLPAGRPHIGVRSSALKLAASAGWTYQALQKSDNVSQFWLSGFNAITSAAGETLTFTSDNASVFDSIEIEALRQPGGGTIEISLDGNVKSSFDLDAPTVAPLVLRLTPEGAPNDRFRKMEIRTQKEGSVSIASVGVYNRRSGISYSSIGYPGASIDLLNKFDKNLMADDLRRLNPQIVVLAFGTNEASNKNLDPERYRRNYEKAIDRITSVLPNAKIMLIGPPDGAERDAHCVGKPAAESVCRAGQYDGSTPAPASQPGDCNWHQLPKLDMVRGIVSKIAQQRGFSYWNWASIMPRECGTHVWATASPPLMTPDHVHFTIAGYNKGAETFMAALIPLIEKAQVSANAVTEGGRN
jgi:lysophospholipase L1-like esterase